MAKEEMNAQECDKNQKNENVKNGEACQKEGKCQDNTQQCECGKEKHQEEKKEQEKLSPEEMLQRNLKEAQDKVAELQDKYLRLSAEFDNYRKRTQKEKVEIIKNGGEKTIVAILPVLDDLERAIANLRKSEETKEVLKGIELINSKFMKILSQEGLTIIETEGNTFDTDYHEAIAMVPAQSEEQKGKILDCVQTGYKLNDKVIRHAKVAVAQ